MPLLSGALGGTEDAEGTVVVYFMEEKDSNKKWSPGPSGNRIRNLSLSRGVW